MVTSPDVPPLAFLLGYAVIALGVSGGVAYLLYARRHELA